MVIRKAVLILFFLLLAVGLAACGMKERYGEIVQIIDNEITIKTGTYQEPEISESSSKKETDTSSPRSGGRFMADGNVETFPLSADVDTSGLVKNNLVLLTFTGDQVVSIEVLQPEQAKNKEIKASKAKSATASGVYIVDNREKISVNQSFDSSSADVSSVLVKNNGTLDLREGRLTKSGNTSSSVASRRYGLNSVLLVSENSRASVKNTTFHSSAVGGTAVFVVGSETKASLSNFKLYTTERSSKGLNAAYGGSITASSGKISTKGAYSAPIGIYKGGGNLKVHNTTVKSIGEKSPCIYSDGSITCTEVNGNASSSPIAIVKGNSRLILKTCLLQGAGKNGIMLYNHDEADRASVEVSDKTRSVFKATNSKLTTTSKGPMFSVTNTNAFVTLKNTTLYFSSGVLANVSGNTKENWGVMGKNGGNLTLKGIHQTLKGDIKCDAISRISLVLTQNSRFKGAINHNDKAGHTAVSLDKTSSWSITGDSYVTELKNGDSSCRNIHSNGHNIYYDADNSANGWLKGNSVSLPGGGTLTPLKPLN